MSKDRINYTLTILCSDLEVNSTMNLVPYLQIVCNITPNTFHYGGSVYRGYWLFEGKYVNLEETDIGNF